VSEAMDNQAIGKMIDDTIDKIIYLGINSITRSIDGHEISVTNSPDIRIVKVDGVEFVSRGYGWKVKGNQE
jgi:hypothetical protein